MMNPPDSFVELLCRRAHQHPDRWAFTFLDGAGQSVDEVTYGQLFDRTKAIAAKLQQHSTSGQRAVLVYPPGIEFIAAFLGCLCAGAVAVPVYPPDPMRLARTLNRFLATTRDAKPAVVLGQASVLPAVKALAEEHEVRLDAEWLATDELHSNMGSTWREPTVAQDLPAMLQYTSGSTSTPKGIVLRHRELLYNQRLIQEAAQHSEELVVCGWLPPYHDMGLIGFIMQPLYVGGGCVLMSPVTFLRRPIIWLQAVSKFRAETTGGPNFAFDLAVRKTTPHQRAQLDLSSLKVVFNGSEPVRQETMDRFAEAFAASGFERSAFLSCYGLAEATLMVTGTPVGQDVSTLTVDLAKLSVGMLEIADGNRGDCQQLASCGRPRGDTQLAIVDPETLKPLPDGRIGEILVAGTTVAGGYWHRTADTEGVFDLTIEGGGKERFLRTGDLGFIHSGELYVSGRLKDLIVIRGKNHFPQDVERTVEQAHWAVRAGGAAAFVVDGDGETRLVVLAEIERRLYADRREMDSSKPEQPEDRRWAHRREQEVLPFEPVHQRLWEPNEVVAAVRRCVAECHGLRAWRVLLLVAGSLPKTSSGKVQRFQCRAQYQAGTLTTIDVS